jgi:membrane protease YdiL (CAAX protease family)
MRALAWFLGLILLGLAAIAVFSYPLWTLLHPYFNFPFHRLGERIGMLVLLIAFVLAAGRLRLNDRTSLGYGVPRRVFLRQMATGLALGVATMLMVVAIMTALGLLDWTAAAALTAAGLAKLVALRLSSGLAVAFIEETFLRGAMLTAIERESGATTAVLSTAVVYSATHFFASYRIAAGDVSARSGLDLLQGTLHLFAHPLGIADAFLCLFAVGIVLGMIRVLNGNIAACIGLHAGWIWVMLVVHEMSQPLRGAPLHFLLSRFDGFVGWLVLAWTIPLGFVLRRFYASGANKSSRAIGSSISR